MKSTNLNHRDELQSQMSAGQTLRESSGDTELVKKVKMVGTPFTVIQYGEKWYLMMGRYRLNEDPYNTQLEAEKYLEENTWDVILKMIVIVIEQTPAAIQDTNKKH